MFRASLLAALSIFVCASGVALGEEQQIIEESYFVPADEPGIQLYVRNKRPEGMRDFSPGRTVLLIHGSTYPAEASFDLRLDGVSWMEYLARRGFDVYLMDVRGYGRSTRPEAMSHPATENPPVVHTDEAVRDVGSVVEHILSRRAIPRLNLLGWSWGTVLAGAYSALNSQRVDRLVLYAPMFTRTTPAPVAAAAPLGAYRTVTREAAEQRRRSGLPDATSKEIMPPAWLDAWWNANLQSDPAGAAQDPPVVRAPNGVLDDNARYWSAGKPYYDPSTITVPTLLILAEWDADTPLYMAQAVFSRLVHVPRKRLVIIGEGTHGVMLEKNRMQLFREVQLFIEEPD
jgi:pimeloyl-ACP methyl ester carboxylesterase